MRSFVRGQWRRRACWAPVPVALLVVVGACSEPGLRRSVEIDGASRTYFVRLPPLVDSTPPRPLVMVLHGVGSSGPDVASMTGLDRLGDSVGFMTVYPNGTGRRKARAWRTESGPNGEYDVQFLRSVLRDVSREFPVDRDRIFVAGFSNGGIMAHRLACAMASDLAAIGAVAGAPDRIDCAPSAPISVMTIHGTADRVLSYAAAQSAHAFWLARNECDDPVVTPELNRSLIVSRAVCPGGAAVSLITIVRGGHDWPRGRSDTEFAASRELWSFFEAHGGVPSE